MRVQHSLKNMVFGLMGQILSIIMGFIVRTVFIKTLGIEYLSVSGLFTNILTVLSLANLGFDSAMIYSLYKPLAEQEKRKIQGLMILYKKAYFYIGIVILVIGLSLIPFLSYLMNGETTINQIKLIYILFLLQSASSYFFIYKQSIIIADQHNHIISKIHSVFTFFSNLFQIVLLISTYNFILVLLLQLIMGIIKNVYISNKANKLYPFINERNKEGLSLKDKRSFFKNLYSLMLYKISAVVIDGTDNIVISKFVGLTWVGIYSNYYLIIATLNTFLSYIFYSVTASVGNLIVKENDEKKYFIFRVINFANFWIFGFSAVCLWNLFNPFMEMWLGKQYVMNKFIVFAIILDFYTTGMQNASTTFRETTGLFKKGKYRPIIAAIVNIGASIILAREIGIAGVFLGTVVSRLVTYFWYDPYIIFKLVFKKRVRTHFIKYIVFFLLVLAASIISNAFANMTGNKTFSDIVIRGLISFVVSNTIFFIMYKESDEFKYLWNIIRNMTARQILNKKEDNYIAKKNKTS